LGGKTGWQVHALRLDQIGLERFHYEGKMIGHEMVSAHLKVGRSARAAMRNSAGFEIL